MKLATLALTLPLAIGNLMAQLVAPNPQGVAQGHLHLLVKDVDEQRKFWVALGGTPVENGALQLIQFPGTFIMLRKAEPSAGSVGSVIDHVGFNVKNMKESVDKWQAAGIKVTPGGGPAQSFVATTDGMRLEILEDKNLPVPIRFQHIHYALPSFAEAQAWYGKVFGAIAGKRGTNEAADVPGANLSFREVKDPLPGTKGRALDHIGFEVKNLPEFIKKLEDQGIKLDAPMRKAPNGTTSIAFLSDPWGTYIELTENLAPQSK